MTYQAEAFKEFFIKGGAKETSATYYSSYLKRIDAALKEDGREGLDEAIAANVDGLRKWAKTTQSPPFDKKPSDPRSVLNKYLAFRNSLGELPEAGDPTDTQTQEPLEPVGLAFTLERDLQTAIRRQISYLEDGLKIVDGGSERHVLTGSIDILAKDNNGVFVVIELKAGDCPKGALEQLLGYAKDIKDEEGVGEVRMCLIAKSFSDRTLAASTFISNLKLIEYDYTVSFRPVE